MVMYTLACTQAPTFKNLPIHVESPTASFHLTASFTERA
uniref:Uncharacterized protein n=1 Tax=Anguilla anguilla TaxID=7936 RepID=A0A0E9XPP2_ANGAN